MILKKDHTLDINILVVYERLKKEHLAVQRFTEYVRIYTSNLFNEQIITKRAISLQYDQDMDMVINRSMLSDQNRGNDG